MDQVLGLECTICSARYLVNEITYVCPKHGDDGVVDVIYDYSLIREQISTSKLADNGDHSIWRYLPLLPVKADAARQLSEGTILAHVGWTPLLPVPRLAARLGLNRLWVKDEGRQPTASLKDRASAIAIVKTREMGLGMVTTASTGNAAAALSGLCAAVSQPNVIFVPRTAPQVKIAQLLVFGSTVLLVDGTYDDAFELCLKAASEFGWYNRSTGYNPYVSEGKKTAAYEICEQLQWQAPDRIFVPVGDGCIIGGLYKGLRDMMALGWIDRMPRLMGVQAAGSAALSDAWERGLKATEMHPIEAHTIADSIRAGLPRDRIKALRAVRESDGAFIRVTDEEIVRAIPILARGCGIFAEPAAAAAYAGLEKAVDLGLVNHDERMVVLVTGSGLKDVATAIKSVAKPSVISADLAEVRRVLKQAGDSVVR
ncbi:MAG: threonine synthase [Acidobacteriia bacterium]|nr:threonine synthase [Terriglobia bacterium]